MSYKKFKLFEILFNAWSLEFGIYQKSLAITFILLYISILYFLVDLSMKVDDFGQDLDCRTFTIEFLQYTALLICFYFKSE